MKLLEKFKGASRHEKAAEEYLPTVDKINGRAEEMKGLSDEDLKARVTQYQGKELAELRRHKAEIFAAIREASERVLKMRHFDVQLTGGLTLLDGRIAEMKTGEGKTLAATLPLILHGLSGKGAHLVTVNDYLAPRDAEWMKPLYEFFELTVGVVVPGMSAEEKRAAYDCSITYGTNNEFGFDYLRDNMAAQEEDLAQGELNFAIVDEVDSILIDEARTPLIISAPDAESTQLYGQFAGMVPRLKVEDDYNIDEKRKAATLTDDGVQKIEEMLGIDNIYEEKGIRFVHHLEQALRAHTLYDKDKDYVVKDGQVVIVDEFTGRLMEGRRYSEGLHQAIEAKERVKVQQESRTLATITFQNLFRLYDTLSGMTGTAVTSAEEFEGVYNLEVVVVPTNQKLVRNDRPDKIFVSEQAKFTNVVEEIKARHSKGQPVLVGTIAIEKSEYLSQLLKKEGVPHEVLNAKHHAREAEIITKAGQKGAVTISTNMAGRGTDIKLGEGVAEVGGLFVLGTERHEARRIDNQLRGRSGRQGDAGETQFFVSLEDDVMRIFGGSKIKGLMEKLKLPEDEPIENKMITKALTGAQERVEGYYFDMRKQVLSYDDVLNRQRGAIYTLRRSVMLGGKWKEHEQEAIELNDYVPELLQEQAEQLVLTHSGEKEVSSWDIKEMAETVNALTGIDAKQKEDEWREIAEKAESDGPDNAREKLQEAVIHALEEKWQARVQELGAENIKHLERAAALRAVDTHWMDHLDTMDYLRTGIGLRGYGQRDPLVEYQREGYQLFQKLLGTIKASFIDVVFRAQPAYAEAAADRAPVNIKTQMAGGEEGSSLHAMASGQAGANQSGAADSGAPVGGGGKTIVNEHKNVGRNDPCYCGSGKKFKKCHGR